jgi:hypothetical protein
MKDMHNNIKVVAAIAPAVKTDAETGGTIDLRGFGSAEIVVNTGALVGAGDFGFKLQHSHTTENGDFSDVTGADLLGTAPAAAMTAASVYKVGYVGGRRYIRVATLDNGGTSLAIGAVAILGEPQIAPAA